MKNVFLYVENNKIFDPVRKKRVVLTPEEGVRQHLIEYMKDVLKIPFGSMAVEKAFVLNGKTHRADIVVYNKKMEAVLLVECKAFGVKLNHLTKEQLSRYALAIKASYYVSYNGDDCHCYYMDKQSAEVSVLSNIPNWEQLNQ